MDQHFLQRLHDVYRTVLRLSWGASRASPCTALVRLYFHCCKRSVALLSLLARFDRAISRGRSRSRNVLSPNALVRSQKPADAIRIARDRDVCDRHRLYNGYGTGLGVFLCRTPLVALDLLEWNGSHAVDDYSHLFRHTETAASDSEARAALPELAWLSLCQSRSGTSIRRIGSRAAARLVSFVAHHWFGRFRTLPRPICNR